MLVYLLLAESEKQRRNRVVPRKRRAVMRRRPENAQYLLCLCQWPFVACLHQVRDLCGLKQEALTGGKMWLTMMTSTGTRTFVCQDKHLIIYVLNDCLKCQDTILRKAIPLNKRVGIALWYLATNMDFRSLGHLFGVSKSTVCHIIKEVCAAIRYVLLPKYIKVPSGEALQHVMSGFKRRLGFPQCAGAVDGTHIPIVASHECPADYYNRKG